LQPKHAISTEFGRFYSSLPGFEDLTLASVTSIINVLSKDALVNAAAKRVAERAVNEEEIWHVLQQEESDEAAIKWVSSAARNYMAYAQALGSAVHAWCETWPERPEVVPWIDKMVIWEPDRDKCYKTIKETASQYGRFLEDTGAELLETERTVFNDEMGYAGTLDLVAVIDGKTYIIDIKTGFVSRESVPLQLAAYRHANYKVVGDASVPFDYPIDGGYVLQLKPRSYRLIPVECGPKEWGYFLYAKALWHWKNEDSKGALG